MSRYIDADTFIKEVVKIQDLRRLSTATIGEALDRTPTADVKPVVRGEWRLLPSIYDDNTWQCTACGEVQVVLCGNPELNGMHYCPNCGAKMKEKA